jgi:hypothetical protein
MRGKDDPEMETKKKINEKIDFFMHLSSETARQFERVQQLRSEEATIRHRIANADANLRQRFHEKDLQLAEARKENRRLREQLEMHSVMDLESVYTNTESIVKLNRSYGIGVTRDDILEKAYDIAKHPHRYPSLFIKELGDQEFAEDSKNQSGAAPSA